jgi:hypothetical protein
VGCHREGPDGIERGKSHGFRADRKLCASCHTDTALSAQWADDGARVEKDARALWDGLRTLGAFDLARRTDAHARPEPRSVPPHASTVSAKNADPAVARAAHDLALILEDRGFLSHNLPYARLLLERARPTIERAVRAAPHRAGREPTR